MVNKIKKKLVINKSKYDDDDYILFLHNITKYGDGWKQVIRGTYKKCLEVKRYKENEKVF